MKYVMFLLSAITLSACSTTQLGAVLKGAGDGLKNTPRTQWVNPSVPQTTITNCSTSVYGQTAYTHCQQY